MKIYDISQELFSCAVYPGDEPPVRSVLKSMEDGSMYNLTAFSMCAHNGTHIDAPNHFCFDGITVEQIALEAVIGKCFVFQEAGGITADRAESMLAQARERDSEAAKRILIGGDITVTPEAAEVFARERILLLGNESQTVGPLMSPAQVHCTLLDAGTVLLEGIRLGEVPEGVYLLNAAPLNLGGCDGAPCRAVLIRI